MVGTRFWQKKHFLFFVSLVCGTVFLDQLFKWLVVRNMPHFGGSHFSLEFIKNTGAGFGILQGNALALAFFSLAVFLVLLILYPKTSDKVLPQLWYGLLLGGIIGNMLDRFIRGFVVDYLNFSFWPAFNLADAVLTIAVLGLAFYYWKT